MLEEILPDRSLRMLEAIPFRLQRLQDLPAAREQIFELLSGSPRRLTQLRPHPLRRLVRDRVGFFRRRVFYKWSMTARLEAQQQAAASSACTHFVLERYMGRRNVAYAMHGRVIERLSDPSRVRLAPLGGGRSYLLLGFIPAAFQSFTGFA